MPRQLTQEQEQLLNEIIALREYDDPNQAIIEVFQEVIDEYREDELLRAELQPAIDQADRGETVVWTEELRKEIRDSAMARFAAGERRFEPA